MTVGIFSIGLSALQASQAGLRVAAQNVANANTPGYARTELNVTTVVIGGQGGGVQVDGVLRAANAFLARATHDATGLEAGASARADFWSRAQELFGDPSGANSLFAQLDSLWIGMSNAALDPSSPTRRAETVNAIDQALGGLAGAAATVQQLASEADVRLSEAVARAQSLIDGISGLNAQIGVTSSVNGDITGQQNAQSRLIDELASLVDVRVATKANGTVEVRTSAGSLLVGESASRLSHSPVAGDYALYNPVQLTDSSGAAYPLDPYVRSGEIRGLLDARDRDMKELSESLGAFAGLLADALNAVHAENTSAPPPQLLTGRNTGLVETDALGFSGKAVIAVAHADQTLLNRLTIDFDTQTITSEAPGGVYSFVNRIGDDAQPDTSFMEALNAALGPTGGWATFDQGTLTLSGGTYGVAVQQDPTTPSERAGRGFSHFFGLNDLVTRTAPIFFETGGLAGDPHGLVAGGEMTFQIRDGLGRQVANRSIQIAGPLADPTATWADLAAALNATGTGIGEYANVTYDNAAGRLTLQAQGGFRAAISADSTSRGDTGLSVSALFGLTDASRGTRATELAVRHDIVTSPQRLALGRPDLSTAMLGQRFVEQGDAAGARALAAARDAPRNIAASGLMAAQTASLGIYATRFGGEIGRRAIQADREAQAANAVATAANERRASTEGVSIDDELITLTTYQQSYAAAARVIQAATEMFDLLLRLGA